MVSSVAGIQEKEQRGWKDQLYPVESDTFLKNYVCLIGSWMFQSGVEKENVVLKYGGASPVG